MTSFDNYSQLRILLTDFSLRASVKISEYKCKESNVSKPELFSQAKDTEEDSDKCLIINEDIWEMYKKAEASFWTIREKDLSNDSNDWEIMSDFDKVCVKRILSFSAVTVYILKTHLVLDFCCEIQSIESKCFLGSQITIENVHFDVFGLLMKTYYNNKIDVKEMTYLIETESAFQRKVLWMMKWCNRHKFSFAERIIALAIIEGIFFSGSICTLLWFKMRGLMSGLTTISEAISCDITKHCEFACLTYNSLSNVLPRHYVVEMIQEAVDIECDYARIALSVHLLGMSITELTQYIQCCADRILISLRYEKLYEIQNPYDWMDTISMKGKLYEDKENYQVFNYKDVSTELATKYSLPFSTF